MLGNSTATVKPFGIKDMEQAGLQDFFSQLYNDIVLSFNSGYGSVLCGVGFSHSLGITHSLQKSRHEAQ